ncbi:hypothetical protein ACTFIZ_006214 [Dictyostelium cf. discoideum]
MKLKNNYNEDKGDEIKSLNNNYNKYNQIDNYQRVNDYSDDFKHCLVFFIFGLLIWLPLIFNIVFFRSPNIQARKLSIASMVIGGCYFVVTVIIFGVFSQ